MKIAQINATCGVGSTGKICVSISKLLSEKKIENKVFYSSGQSDYPLGVRYMTDIEIKKGALEARLCGNFGFNSSSATRRLVTKLKNMEPDIIHIHNIHSHNCNLDIFFRYLKEEHKKIIWTFHDCWAFTGHCTYFSFADCNHWQKECSHCPKVHEFSWIFDTTSKLFQKKKELFKGLDMIIVSPSQWLADLVKESFLSEYPVEVINNGIDLSVFRPSESFFRNKYSIAPDEKVILGVAFDWGIRKGLDVFIELSKRLDLKYRIVLVGTNDKIDKKLPSRIISIHRTNNQKELAEIYTAADLYINPTREDNYPTVNMEALACGTPVITFNTGGSSECIAQKCGMIVDAEDVDSMEKAIYYLMSGQKNMKEPCLQQAVLFDQDRCFQKYIDCYRRMFKL